MTPVLNVISFDDWVVCTKYNSSIIDMLGLRNVVVLNRDPGILDFLKIMRTLGKTSFSSSIILDCTAVGNFGIAVSKLLRVEKIFSGFETSEKGDFYTDEILLGDDQLDIVSLASASIAREILLTGDAELKKNINVHCDDKFRNYEDFIGIHIGGFGSVNYGVSRQYPEEHIFELARALLNIGHKVLVTGDKADGKRFTKYAKALQGEKGFVDLSGKLDVKQLACLLKAINCYITPDNGTLHLAQAVGCRKVLAVIGPTNPTLVRGRNTEIIRLDLPCSPCIEFIKFPDRCVNPENNACLNRMNPQIILDRLNPHTGRTARR